MFTTVELQEYVEYHSEKPLASHSFYAAHYSVRGPALDSLVSELKNIVDLESPIHVAAATRRLASLFGIFRSGRVVREIADNAIRVAISRKQIRWSGDFLISTSSLAIIPRRRGSANGHPIEQVAIGEIIEAMATLLEAHIGMIEDSLATEAARILGYNRTGAKVKKRMREAIEAMATKGQIIRQGEQWVLRKGV